MHHMKKLKLLARDILRKQKQKTTMALFCSSVKYAMTVTQYAQYKDPENKDPQLSVNQIQRDKFGSKKVNKLHLSH